MAYKHSLNFFEAIQLIRQIFFPFLIYVACSTVKVIKKKLCAVCVRIWIRKIHCSVLIAIYLLPLLLLCPHSYNLICTQLQNHLPHTCTTKTGILALHVLVHTAARKHTHTHAHIHTERNREEDRIRTVAARTHVLVCAERELLGFYYYIWHKLHDILFSRSLNTGQINTFIQEIIQKPRGSKYTFHIRFLYFFFQVCFHFHSLW